MATSSNAQRSPTAVLISAHKHTSGYVRVVFDQVRANTDSFPQVTRSHVFLTRNEYEESHFPSNLSDAQYQELGEVLAALLSPCIHDPGRAAQQAAEADGRTR